MITLVTTCKPFEGISDHIQRTALRSWKSLGADVMVLGDDPGVASACREMGIWHIPKIPYTRDGAPDLHGLLETAKEASRTELMSYVNADIVLFPNFIPTVKAASCHFVRFIMCGQRIDAPPINATFSPSAAWRAMARDHIDTHGKLHGPTGLDYFVFRRFMLPCQTVSLSIGRLAWDNYLPWLARTRDDAAFIDATQAITAWHQNHPVRRDYDNDLAAQHNHCVVSEDYGMLQLPDADYEMTGDYAIHARIAV